MTNNHVFYNKQRAIKALCFFCFLMVGAVTAHATGTDYYFKATATALPTGAGTVYVSDKNDDSNATYGATSTVSWKGNSGQDAASSTVYLFAKPADGYAFDHWEYKYGNTTQKLTTSRAQLTVTSGKTSESDPATTDFTAIFAKEGLVKVASDNESMGTVSISKADNTTGDVVTIEASNDILSSKFTGWKLNGEGDYIKENPLTITVDGAAKYIAYFEKASTEGEFYFAYNTGTSTGRPYFGIIGSVDNVSRDQRYLKHSVILISEDNAHRDPAAVLRIKGTSDGNGGLTSASLISQGTNTYVISKNNYFNIGKQGDGKYTIQGKVGSMTGYLLDYMDSRDEITRYGEKTTVNHPGVFNQSVFEGTAFWNFKPIDEMHVETNYFGPTPNEKMKCTIDGTDYYLTTMYTSFPYKCYAPDGVRAFYVQNVTDGKAQLIEVANGEVPSNTGVILACKGLTSRENRLIPSTTEYAALEGSNLLEGSFQLTTDLDDVDKDKTTFDASTMRVLSTNSKGVVGFYKLADDTMMSPNKAWLTGYFGTSGAKILLDFDGATTGIEEVAQPEAPARKQDNAWYNLQGQRVEHPQHGIFIHNGKKVVIK